MTAVWKTTKSDSALPFTCDCCSAPASVVYFVPSVKTCEEVLLACSAHNPGGWSIGVADLASDWVRPLILEKVGGQHALELLEARVAPLRLVASSD